MTLFNKIKGKQLISSGFCLRDFIEVLGGRVFKYSNMIPVLVSGLCTNAFRLEKKQDTSAHGLAGKMLKRFWSVRNTWICYKYNKSLESSYISGTAGVRFQCCYSC